MTQVLVWLSSHPTSWGILGAAIGFIWSVVQFIYQRRRESNERQFEAYHKLIKEIDLTLKHIRKLGARRQSRRGRPNLDQRGSVCVRTSAVPPGQILSSTFPQRCRAGLGWFAL